MAALYALPLPPRVLPTSHHPTPATTSACHSDSVRGISPRGGQQPHAQHPPTNPCLLFPPSSCWRTSPAFLRSYGYGRHLRLQPSPSIFCTTRSTPAGTPAEKIPRHSGRKWIFCISELSRPRCRVPVFHLPPPGFPAIGSQRRLGDKPPSRTALWKVGNRHVASDGCCTTCILALDTHRVRL